MTINEETFLGARTLDEIKEMTGAATGCGRCKALVQNVIELKR